MAEAVRSSRHRSRHGKRRRRRRSSRRARTRRLLVLVGLGLAGFALVMLLVIAAEPPAPPTVVDTAPDEPLVNDALLDLPANRWVLVREGRSGNWHRSAHGAAVFDSRRKKVFVFGSDTHGKDYDDSVHEFDPLTVQWSDHRTPARRRTYHVDEQGLPVAGSGELRPWAMHVYDGMVYDPKLDALVVSGVPRHNPATKTIDGISRHPVWIYHLDSRRWEPLADTDPAAPPFFGSAAAYDSRRDTIVVVGKGTWELGPDRRQWVRTAAQPEDSRRQTLVYAAGEGNFYLFGDDGDPQTLQVYVPGETPGSPGRWETRHPEGDPACAAATPVPVAYEPRQGVFLLQVDRRLAKAKEPKTKAKPTEGKSKQGSADDKDNKAKSEQKPAGKAKGDEAGPATESWAYVYEPRADRCTPLPGTRLGALGMDYMLVFDDFYKLFLLVSGDDRKPLAVHALRLDMEFLQGEPAQYD